MKRKSAYMGWVKHFFPRLLQMQDMRENGKTFGCFFYPFCYGKVKYVNARWQEAVATLSWALDKGIGKQADIKKRLEAGIEFLGKVQNRDGSFPEYTARDRSFSATSFVTLSATNVCIKTGLASDALLRAGDWLCRNDETVLSNQSAAAAAALLRLYKMEGKKKYLEAAENKLGIVLRNQGKEGYYKEKGGYDFGYSSLTLSMLGQYSTISPEKRITDSARRFISLSLKPRPRVGSRGTNWAVMDGFEFFSRQIPEAMGAISGLFSDMSVDIIHIPDERHICTDLYRICNAIDYIRKECDVQERRIAEPERFSPPERTVRSLIRPLGVHKIRKIKYLARR